MLQQPRLRATFRPQAWIDDHATDVDGKVEFDATFQFLRLSLAEIKAFESSDYPSDFLADNLPARESHEGPFEVDVEVDEWLEANGVGNRQGMTQTDLNVLRMRYGERFAVMEDAGKYHKCRLILGAAKTNLGWAEQIWLGQELGFLHYVLIRHDNNSPEDPTMPQGCYQAYWPYELLFERETEEQQLDTVHFSAEEQEEYRGLYEEEVQKLVDGIEAEILEGHLTGKPQAEQQLMDAVAVSSWTQSGSLLAIYVLQFSGVACAALYREITFCAFPLDDVLPPAQVAQIAAGRKSGDSQGSLLLWTPGEPFPFAWFAHQAMAADCFLALEQRAPYKDLPV